MKPSRWWHLLSLFVFIVFGMCSPFIVVIPLFMMLSAGEEFFTPGRHEMKLEKPGKYTIWCVTSEFRDGRQYNFPDTLPNGTRITVINQSSGKEIPTQPAMQCTESAGTSSRSSICDFDIDTPGNYAISVEGNSEQRLLMVRRSLMKSIMTLFIGSFLTASIGIFFPVIFSGIIEIRRYRAAKSRTPPPLPAE